MRDIRFDTLRGVLICAVVFGHLIEAGVRQGGPVRDVYILIYLVHMPLFAAVSGYFSTRSAKLSRLVRSVVVPFVLAELAYRLFHFALTGKVYSFVEPYWHLWFLLSLACWRLLLPLWMRLKYPVALAIAASLFAGGIDAVGLPFSLSRTIYFFVFFVLGHQLATRSGLDSGPRWLAIVVLVAAPVVVVLLPSSYSLDWLYGALGYAELGVGFAEGAAIRATHYAASLLLCFAVFSLIPQRDSVLSLIGTKTVTIYLLHGFIVLLLQKFGFGAGSNVLLLSALIAIVIVYVFGVIWRSERRTF